MTKVSIISSTSNAAELLIFTKSTRLNMSPGLMDDIAGWSDEKKDQELKYISKTIKSSWEFIDITFLIEGVTRAVAQQITRTRNASYAMQSQRVTDCSRIEVTNPFPSSDCKNYMMENAIKNTKLNYEALIRAGAKLEDARSILPMNTQCNLVAKYNLRSLSDLIKARKSLRAQGEYNNIVLQMESLVVEQWPWCKDFFISDKQVAIDMLEAVAKKIGIETGRGDGWEIAKAIDLIRKD